MRIGGSRSPSICPSCGDEVPARMFQILDEITQLPWCRRCLVDMGTIEDVPTAHFDDVLAIYERLRDRIGETGDPELIELIMQLSELVIQGYQSGAE